jgi:hypothetical protein
MAISAIVLIAASAGGYIAGIFRGTLTVSVAKFLFPSLTGARLRTILLLVVQSVLLRRLRGRCTLQKGNGASLGVVGGGLWTLLFAADLGALVFALASSSPAALGLPHTGWYRVRIRGRMLALILVVGE